MADIFPFSAWRYDPNRVDLNSVVTQPYDKITPQMQERYYAASPHNFVRLILGKQQGGDNGHDVYTRAADYWKSWRAEGILRQDETPSIYAYSQEFASPGQSARAIRSGFIAIGRLHDYTDKVIFRHEQTLSAPKADRLNLLRSTNANLEQLFLLYGDPTGKIDSLLAKSRTGEVCVEDEYKVRHNLWRISDPQIIQTICDYIRDKQLIIADGHHRYETALNYRNERRRVEGVTQPKACVPYEKGMMTFVNMDAPGLVILPTHRVVSGADRDRVKNLLAAAHQFFRVQSISSAELSPALADVQRAGRQGIAILVVTANQFHLLEANHQAISKLLATVSPRQQKLDVVVLHKVLLEHLLGLTEESIREQRNIQYYRDAEEAIEQVRAQSAQLAFLLNPVTATQLHEVALAGEVMPQKSTDFYPKLLSGLTMYALD